MFVLHAQVTGTVSDADGVPRWTLKGYWDEMMECSKILSGEGKGVVTDSPRRLWTLQPPQWVQGKRPSPFCYGHAHVCLAVHMYVSLCTCMSCCAHVCLAMHMYVSLCTCMSRYGHAHVCLTVHLYVSLCTRMSRCAHVCLAMHMYGTLYSTHMSPENSHNLRFIWRL